jgi:hypothetical protein
MFEEMTNAPVLSGKSYLFKGAYCTNINTVPFHSRDYY